MKKLILALVLITSGVVNAQTDFTIDNGSIKWGETQGTTRGSLSCGNDKNSYVLDASGRRIFALQLSGQEWANHTINGDTTLSFHQFDSIASIYNFGYQDNIDVNVQDQTTRSVGFKFTRRLTSAYSLATPTIPNSYRIGLTDATGISVNDKISLCQDHSAPAKFFAYVTAIDNDTLVVNVPMDVVFSSDNDACLYVVDNTLNELGSPSSQVIYSIKNESSIPIDITRLMFKMITDDTPNLLTFGDLPALEHGMLVRMKLLDGTYNNIYNIRVNSEFVLIAYDYDTYLATNPQQGQNGLGVRLTFAGQEKHGVALRIMGYEELQIVCQDDYTDILDFKVMGQGHYTDEW